MGFTKVDGFCTQQCGAGQLVDPLGQCYVCLINEMVQNNQCVCKDGFTRNAQNICMRMCDEGKVLIRGICGICVLGSIYNPLLEECVCPVGQYRNNFGICIKS